MDRPWKVVFAFVAVFIAGAVFGGVFTLRGSGQRIVPRQQQSGRPPAPPPIGIAIMQQLVDRLKLTDEQREKIRPYIARVSEDLQRMRRENFQATNRVLERMHDDLSAFLTPEQRNELAGIRRGMQQRLNNGAKRGDAPPPPRPNLRNPEPQRQPPPKTEPPI